MTTVVYTTSGSWTAPSGVTSVDCAAWGESGSAANGTSGSHSGGGAGGGEYAEETTLAVTPGSVYNFTIGTGGTGTATTFPGDSVTVTAHAGASATTVNGAVGGSGSTNAINNPGGHGGNGASGTDKGGGGGGGSGGSGGAGGTGGTGTTVGGSGGSAGTGTNAGEAGAAGGGPTSAGGNGNVPGGAPGGGGNNGNRAGGNAVSGQIQLTYSAPMSGTAALTGVGTLTAQGGPAGDAALAGVGTLTAAQSGAGNATLTGTGTLTADATQRAGATLTGVGTLTASGGLPSPAAVNQWAGTFSQPASFSSMPPALQSTVIALNGSTSVGGGSGTPTEGNWLFCLSGWNQDGLAPVATGDADDIHSFWRPAQVSQKASANTRASVWYTPNIARTVNDVYAAPNGAVAGMAVLVVEISGLGPWDTVTGADANYAAAATSLNLALSAPASASFVIACVCGDSTAASQAFAPSGWTALSTVTATDGTDHTCDAVLTSAFLPSTSGSVSVNGTAGSDTDLSGVILAVAVAGASPIPGGANPAWAGRMILEAGFGSGFETPLDEITWTALSDSAPTWRASNKPRFWGWQDDSGVPYTLGQLQSSTGAVQLDNADGYLSPANSESPWYPDVVTGTPLRLRCALGSFTGPEGTTVINRWYVLARNALEFPEKRNDAWRNYVETALTDIWSVVSASCPTPFRGEILAESSLYAWWTMDDQPLSGGVQPTSLRNSAPGNTNTLGIYASPSGVSSGDAYTTTGTDATSTYPSPNTSVPPPSVATGAVAQQQGWMYGDPQSSPASYATSNPVTASPGSAAWQQTGMQGSGGSNGWYLAVNDSNFPVLADGITVKGWFSAGFFGSATGWKNVSTGDYYDICGQPYSVITLATLSTSSAPVCELQLSLAGALNLITYHSGTATSNTIYNASDLRCNAFTCVDIQLTTTTWAVYVNGGLTAAASGTATGMTSAWTWLTLNGDYGSAGGSSPGSIQHGGNVAYSHWAVFSSILPAWRLLDHYYAAICAAGLLPAPQTTAVSTVGNEFGTGFTPDGADYQGSYGKTGSTTITSFTFSGLAVAVAGSYTSGPSARAVTAGLGTDTGGIFYGDACFLSFTGLSPSVALYTAASADSEEQASVVCGSGDAYTAGFGSGATANGSCHVSGGSGAAPPSGPSALGDDVGQRLERILGYGKVTYPNRAIDPAPLAVQAGCDVGGQQTGANCQNIVSSDNGLLTVDNNGTLCYRQKSHLASDTVVWNLSSAGPAYGYPFKSDQTFDSDPQRVYNAIQIVPYAPDGATLPVITPSSASAVTTSQQQYGVRPLPSPTSYLQSTTEIQNQANWYIAQFGSLHRRVSTLTVDAAGYPPAWLLVLSVNPGDLCQVYDLPMLGGPLSIGTYRVSSVSRKIAFGANQSKPEGSVTLVLDSEPSAWWT